MSNTRNLADLLDSSGDVKSAALDNVPATDISGKLNTSGGTLTGTLTMESTDAGSTAEPELILYRNSPSPASGDYLGQIQFKGENANGGSEIYAKVTGKISDPTHSSEDGLIETAIKGDGSFTIVSRQKADELQLINGVNLDVAGNITVGGTVDGVDIQTLNTTAGAALPKAGGQMTGDILPGTNSVHFADNGKLKLGGGEDLTLYHNGTQSYIENTLGNLLIKTESGTINLQKGSSEYLARFHTDGAVELYHDNTKKLETFASGVYVCKQTSGSLRVGNFVANGTGQGVKIEADSNQGTVVIENSLTSQRSAMLFVNGNGQVGTIQTSGSSTSYNTSSDYRLKENVEDMANATTRLKQLKPKRFNFIADDSVTVDGFLAHEVSSVVPEAISGTKDEVDGDGNAVYQGIDQSKLVPLLVKTIQELEARITTLEG